MMAVSLVQPEVCPPEKLQMQRTLWIEIEMGGLYSALIYLDITLLEKASSHVRRSMDTVFQANTMPLLIALAISYVGCMSGIKVLHHGAAEEKKPLTRRDSEFGRRLKGVDVSRLQLPVSPLSSSIQIQISRS